MHMHIHMHICTYIYIYHIYIYIHPIYNPYNFVLMDTWCRKSDRRNMEGLTIQLLEVLEAPGPASTSTGRFVSSPGTQDRGARHCCQQHFFVGSSTTRSTRFFLSFCVDLVGLVEFGLVILFCLFRALQLLFTLAFSILPDKAVRLSF